MSELQKSVEPRVIQVFFNGEAFNLVTNANKWSEIIPLIENHESGFSVTGKKAVLGSSKGILQLPDALIPEGNQCIFLVQDKMKSGAAIKATKPFTDMGFTDLRRLAKEKGITGLGSNPNRTQLIDALNQATGIKELKGASKAVKEKKATIVKEIKLKAEEIRPDLEERIKALEIGLGTVVNGFSDILNELYKNSMTDVKKSVKSEFTQKVLVAEEKSTTLKTTEELRKEFSKLGV